MYNQFLNRVTGNRENIYTDKQVLLVNTSKYGKWKPTLISESLILFKVL